MVWLGKNYGLSKRAILADESNRLWALETLVMQTKDVAEFFKLDTSDFRVLRTLNALGLNPSN